MEFEKDIEVFKDNNEFKNLLDALVSTIEQERQKSKKLEREITELKQLNIKLVRPFVEFCIFCIW